MKRAILKPLKRPRLPSAPRLTARQWASRLGAILLLLGVILLVKEGVIDPILDSVNQSREEIADAATRLSPVSYTHLTLPTILLV